MNKNRIMVIGKGHLGSYLVARWGTPSELHWTSDMLGLTPADLKRLAPEMVVNTAGKTDLLWCENNPAACFRSNVEGPIHVYRAVKDYVIESSPEQSFAGGCRFVHVSSGCIWDGPYRADGEPFEPTDPPRPACFYSWTKAACDAMLLDEVDSPLLILRPRQVYSASLSPRNTLSKLNSYKDLLKTPNSMTSAETIARTIEAAAARFFFPHFNVMNVYDKGVTSPHRVGVMLHEAGLREMPGLLEKAAMDSWHKPKRVDAVITDDYFEELVSPPHVEEQLRKTIAEYANAVYNRAGENK